MKTCQSTGFFRQVYVRLLLCFISSVVFAASASAFTAPNIINQCYDCHGSPTIAAGGGNDIRPVDSAYRNITTGGFAGNHRTHMLVQTTNANVCTPCHGAQVQAIDHRDGKINMRMHINSSAVNVRGFYNKPVGTPAAFFNQTSVPVLSTCNNVNCHFRKTTTAWGSAPLVGQTEANCAYCHNSSGATPMTTGNHTKHITKLGSTITTCATCHPNQTTFSHATSAKAGRSITVTLAGGTYTPGTHASYPNYFTTTGYGTCNTIYCHSAGQSATGGALTAPNYKAATWGLTLTCAGCHGNSDTTLLSGTHSKHLLGTYNYACSDCHGTGYTSTSVVEGTHVNNLINVSVTNRGATGTYSGDSTPGNSNFGTCNNTNCHGKNSGTWGASVSNQLCTECHGQPNVPYGNFSSAIIAPGGAGVDTGGNTAATAARVGAHQVHLLGSSNISAPMHCGECHFTHTTIADATHLNFTTATVTYQNAVLAKAYSRTPTANRVSGLYNCSNVACHVSSRPVGTGVDQSGTATLPVPVWNNSTLIGGTTIADTCTAKCHNLPPGAAASGDKHFGLVVTTFSHLGSACSGCHSVTLNSSTPNYASIFKDKLQHIDGKVDANGHAAIYPGSAHMGATGATTPLTTCGVGGCHNTTATGPYPALVAGSPPDCRGCHTVGLLRTVSAVASCYDCHGATATDGKPNGVAFPNYSGSHSEHVAKGYTCVQCHANGGTGSPNHGGSARTASTGVAFVHVSSATRDFHFTPTGKGVCSNAYCHSSGQSLNGLSATPVYLPITWGTTGTCDSCHNGTSIATGSHTKHLSISTNCGNCHTGATATAYNSASHVNRSIDVSVGTYTAAGAPGNGYGQCSTAACHGNGKSVFVAATWGGAAMTCDSCHPLASLGGAHARHSGALTIAQVKFYNYTANKSAGQDTTTVANYAFGCANCHPLAAAQHNNGSINVEANSIAGGSTLRAKTTTFTLGGTPGTNTVTCANVYCHSNGQGGNTTTMQWGQTYAAVDRCAQCHGNSPSTTGAHVAHAVGIHSDDVFSGVIGKLAAGNAGSVAHGITTQATTINCDTCHWSTVTYARNRNNSTCSTGGCHPTATDTATTQVARVMLPGHVNGKVEVAFRPINIVSKAQLRPASFVNYTAGTAGWGRSTYKSGAASFDTAKTALNSTAVYTAGAAGAGTCSNIVCHNMKSGDVVTWNSSLTCLSCHSKL